MRAAFPIAIGLVGTFTIFGQVAAAENKLDPKLLAFLQSEFARDLLPGEETRAAVALASLAKQGPPVIVVYLTGNEWCGSGGCTLAFVQSMGGSFRVLSRTPIVALPVKVLPSRTRGWNDVAVGARGRGLARLVFDGEGYGGNPSMSKLVPANQGAVIISEDNRGEPLSP